MTCRVQLLLHIAQEERAVDLCHLEEEGEDVEERGTGQEVGKVLYLFTGGVDTSLLHGIAALCAGPCDILCTVP